MVDLDSNPTKLIEIVEIGKQLLITRGALTTFSIANDVAKYFAMLPVMFASVYPGLRHLNIMGLHSLTSAIIFNALIPLALRSATTSATSQVVGHHLVVAESGRGTEPADCRPV